MIEFIIGAIVSAVVFTFFPSLGLTFNLWLRTAWDWIKAKTGIGPAKLP